MGRRVVLLAAALAMVAGGLAVIAMAGPRSGIAGGLPSPSASGDPGAPGPSFPPPMAAPDLYAALSTPEAGATAYGEAVTLAVVPAGDVRLPSGRLVAVDAMVIHGAEPLATTVDAGLHPVTLLTADFASGDHRVAAAMLRVAEGEPVDWQMAVLPGQDPSTLGPDEIFGYGVDSGSGAFTSPEAIAALEDEAAYQAYSDAVFATMYPDDQTVVDSAAVEVGAGTNVVAFSSGFGDGVYATYVGRDADGRAVVILTDFTVLDAASP